jgi:hypothetical protein
MEPTAPCKTFKTAIDHGIQLLCVLGNLGYVMAVSLSQVRKSLEYNVHANLWQLYKPPQVVFAVMHDPVSTLHSLANLWMR